MCYAMCEQTSKNSQKPETSGRNLEILLLCSIIPSVVPILGFAYNSDTNIIGK